MTGIVSNKRQIIRKRNASDQNVYLENILQRFYDFLEIKK